MCWRLVRATAVVALLLAEPTAHAFCRTTTSKAPVGYDPAVSGCWTQGVPLAWSTDRAPYGVAAAASKQVSLADATRVADLAFSTWNDARCAGQTIGVQAYDDGPIFSLPDASYLPAAGTDASILSQWAACSNSSDCNPQTHDVIVFDDDQWPYNDPANTLALTTVTFGLEDGRIFEAYTEVNAAEHALTTSEPPTAGSGAYDLQAILTHEAGHFFGLAHATDRSAIMYAFYQPGAIRLAPDDIDAICSVYPHAHETRGGCSCAMVEHGSDLAPLTGLLIVLLGAMRRTRST